MNPNFERILIEEKNRKAGLVCNTVLADNTICTKTLGHAGKCGSKDFTTEELVEIHSR